MDGKGRPYFSSACTFNGAKHRIANRSPKNVEETLGLTPCLNWESGLAILCGNTRFFQANIIEGQLT